METKLSNKYIELFAGCGGMSLGLEAAGLKLYFANELSPMAGETYAFNILNDNLREKPKELNTLWLQSQFERNNINRLRENPTEYHKGKYFDLKLCSDLSKKLVIGDINSLNLYLKENPNLINEIQKQEIDLVSGGPPCQSFSLAGKREKGNKRNQLPWAFAEFVEIVQPKLVILENVSGILRPFKEGNKKYYAWFEVAKAFCLKGYVPVCMHINAKYFGLPQSRPRFIMLGIRKDLLKFLEKDEVLDKAFATYNNVQKYGKDLEINENDTFYELNTERAINLFRNSKYLLSPITIDKSEQKNVRYAIDALKNLPSEFAPNLLKSDPYHLKLSSVFPSKIERYKVKNHNHRGHSEKIQNRFKFLKLIEQFDNGERNKLIHALKVGSTVELGSALKRDVIGKLKDVKNVSDLESFVYKYQSKKHSQRALTASKPAPAALSIPDDVCHYDKNHNRTLTVREMARIQSFPDWFEFRSKDTTGGTNRRFEVPNYTQVGNAVPPLLSKEIGHLVKNILNAVK